MVLAARAEEGFRLLVCGRPCLSRVPLKVGVFLSRASNFFFLCLLLVDNVGLGVDRHRSPSPRLFSPSLVPRLSPLPRSAYRVGGCLGPTRSTSLPASATKTRIKNAPQPGQPPFQQNFQPQFGQGPPPQQRGPPRGRGDMPPVDDITVS